MADYIMVGGQLCHSDALYHHGIKGMRWGVRRFQNKDGSLKPAGKKRYITAAQAVSNAKSAAKDARKKSLAESRATESGIGSYRRAMNKASAASKEARRDSIAKDKAYNKQLRSGKKEHDNSAEGKAAAAERRKKALKIGAAVAGTALAAYGAYKLNEYVKTKNCQIAAKRGHDFATDLFDSARTVLSNNTDVGTSGSFTIDANYYARKEAKRAAGDSFAKAAKNVASYKKSGGTLKYLKDLEDYDGIDWYEYINDRRKS